MIKILILTDDIWKWYYFIINMMEIDITIQHFNHIEIRNKMFTFHIRTGFPDSLRGAAFAHVIEDKKISAEDFCHLILPVIKQKVTQYGSHTIIGE